MRSPIDDRLRLIKAGNCQEKSARFQASQGGTSGCNFRTESVRRSLRADNALILWRSLRDSNQCYSLERVLFRPWSYRGILENAGFIGLFCMAVHPGPG